jgi:hypothetical protein
MITLPAFHGFLKPVTDNDPGVGDSGFESWLDGQIVTGISEGSMTFYADGQPIVIQED